MHTHQNRIYFTHVFQHHHAPNSIITMTGLPSYTNLATFKVLSLEVVEVEKYHGKNQDSSSQKHVGFRRPSMYVFGTAACNPDPTSGSSYWLENLRDCDANTGGRYWPRDQNLPLEPRSVDTGTRHIKHRPGINLISTCEKPLAYRHTGCC